MAQSLAVARLFQNPVDQLPIIFVCLRIRKSLADLLIIDELLGF